MIWTILGAGILAPKKAAMIPGAAFCSQIILFVCLSIPIRHPLGLFSVWKRYLFCFFSYLLFACKCLCRSEVLLEHCLLLCFRLVFLLLPWRPHDWVLIHSDSSFPSPGTAYCARLYGGFSLFICTWRVLRQSLQLPCFLLMVWAHGPLGFKSGGEGFFHWDPPTLLLSPSLKDSVFIPKSSSVVQESLPFLRSHLAPCYLKKDLGPSGSSLRSWMWSG